jgi:hypothetical protein
MSEAENQEVAAWLAAYKEELWQYAMLYIEAGLTIMPIRLSSKTPALKWTDMQDKPTTEEDVADWIENGVPDGEGGLSHAFGRGIITGAQS